MCSIASSRGVEHPDRDDRARYSLFSSILPALGGRVDRLVLGGGN